MRRQDVFLSDKKDLALALEGNGKHRNSFFQEESEMPKGRPRIDVGKRSKKFDVRFTEDEYKTILSLEKALGISKTELVRKRTLDKAAITLVNAKELIVSLDHIFAEMGRIGNNINQLAKHVNTLKLRGALSPLVVAQFDARLDLYIQIQQQLEVSLRKVIRLIGKS
ncbi:plasmid mobilization relaxosome protein MobC [Mucilaginibacter sp. 21P]|uniref:plasmid mobilization protein n=1 Tax=Mucilaginibacter sp. 21P TaxID=2778902 RepID=UPI00210431B7|nr:plasmid mobilization relaxosome protein MobC [Mucilaginibacter sp. 21P]